MRRTAAPLGALMWLLFTGNPEARADEAQGPGPRADEPPWRRSGGIIRLGTAAGFSEIGERSISTLGGQVSLGYRLGPVALGVEYERLAMLEYLEEETRNATRGVLSRAGVSGRLFFLRLGGGRGANALMELYVEGGAGRQLGRWATGEEFDRTDVMIGAGWMQDARYRRGRDARLPFHSIGWQLGWRVTAARADGEDVFLRQTCKGKGCGVRAPMPDGDVDIGLIFTCSLSAAWL
jgi:hypothetical protein